MARYFCSSGHSRHGRRRGPLPFFLRSGDFRADGVPSGPPPYLAESAQLVGSGARSRGPPCLFCTQPKKANCCFRDRSAKSKRPTMAQLQKQLGGISQLLPTLSAQLTKQASDQAKAATEAALPKEAQEKHSCSQPTLVKALRAMFPSLCTFELGPLLLFFCLCQSGPRAWPLHMTSSPCPFLTQGLLPMSLELLCRKARVDAGPSRFCSLIDSNVARCATSKGRSSSSSLMTVLQRTAAVSVAFGLYGALPFCPARILPADAPSREADILAPVPGCGLSRSMVMPYCTLLVSRDGPQTGQGSFCGQLPGPSLVRTPASKAAPSSAGLTSPFSLTHPLDSPVKAPFSSWVGFGLFSLGSGFPLQGLPS